MKNFLLLFVFAASLVSSASAQSDFFTKADAFFKKNVRSGKVNYSAIKSRNADLTELMKMVREMDASGMSKNESKAFYINAYNLTVINQVIANYPVEGPLKVDGFFDKTQHKVAGKTMTLNYLENDLMRPKYKDARLHFALVCAAKGCPKIADFAFTPAKVESQLASRTKSAMNDTYLIRVSGNSVKISKIFEWYVADFKAEAADALTWINKYRTTKIPAGAKVGFYEYDWNLNKI